MIESPIDERLVVTAAHCLPQMPEPHPWADETRIWKLLAPLGEEPDIVAECRFVDPVADIAVLGSPNSQDMFEEAEAYDALVAAAALPVGLLPRKEYAKSDAWMLSLAGRWQPCTVNYTQNFALWTKGKHKIEGGMSGSPIVTGNGFALGVLSCSGGLAETDGGPHARLGSHLPGWLLYGIGRAVRSRVSAEGKDMRRRLRKLRPVHIRRSPDPWRQQR